MYRLKRYLYGTRNIITYTCVRAREEIDGQGRVKT